MEISVTVKRSENWVKARRIETGENVSAELKVDIETTDLSPATRQLLLTYTDSYQDLDRIYFDSSYSPARASCYGWVYIKIDSDAPTPAEIDQAILAAFAEIEGKRAEWEVEQAEREEAERQEAAAKEYRKQEEDRARRILKDELDRFKELEAKHQLLGEFVSWIPADACRGALKEMHQSKSKGSLQELQEHIEDSSDWAVFEGNEDDEVQE